MAGPEVEAPCLPAAPEELDPLPESCLAESGFCSREGSLDDSFLPDVAAGSEVEAPCVPEVLEALDPFPESRLAEPAFCSREELFDGPFLSDTGGP